MFKEVNVHVIKFDEFISIIRDLLVKIMDVSFPLMYLIHDLANEGKKLAITNTTEVEGSDFRTKLRDSKTVCLSMCYERTLSKKRNVGHWSYEVSGDTSPSNG